MNLYRVRLSISKSDVSNDRSTKGLHSKKLLSIEGATPLLALLVVLMIGTLRTTESTVASRPILEPVSGDTKPPAGLSRNRNDFEKALTILASAGPGNPILAGYNERVLQRVRGEGDMPEDSSGVKPVKSLSGRSAAPYQALSQSPANGAGSTGDLIIGDLEFRTSPPVDRWIDYYTATERGRRTMEVGIRRSASYLELARAEFRALDLPQDLVWLAHVESVWQVGAVSPAAAGGIWQFIPRTAIEYGLAVEEGLDERFDPDKQTRVAANYLRDLYTIFGDWALAMAAYNCGEPRVMDAIVKNGRADFWELYERRLLPQETCNYVPKILAAIHVAGNAEAYGFWSARQAETPTD